MVQVGEFRPLSSRIISIRQRTTYGEKTVDSVDGFKLTLRLSGKPTLQSNLFKAPVGRANPCNEVFNQVVNHGSA